MNVNKRRILEPMLDRIEPDWYILKPQCSNPYDTDTECIFHHPRDYREAHVHIDNALFLSGNLEEIERLVRAAVANNRSRVPSRLTL